MRRGLPHASSSRPLCPKTYCRNELICRNAGLICPDLSLQVTGHLPQSILSCAPLGHHIARQRVCDIDEDFGDSPVSLKANATGPDGYISSPSEATGSASNPSPSFRSSTSPPPMNYHLGSEATQLSFLDAYTVPGINGGVPQGGAPSCHGDVPDPLFEAYDGTDLTQGMFPSSLYAGDDIVSPAVDYGFDALPPYPPSPASRCSSMSRSSFASFSPCSPGDYPTPASDSAVTTPAPSEACLGWPSEDPQVLLGQHFWFGLDGKMKGTHEPSYVPGSAPLSPTECFTFDLSDLPHPIPSTAAGRFAEARRHSDPANLAALHSAPFFASSRDVPSQFAPVPVPTDFMTRPITDNLASTSASASNSALPSSIAPHQTQLSRPLELKHPKPVRGYKPPILLSGHLYDPKDFVRRRSEPVRALPPLDISSHDPSEEDEDVMEFEDGLEETGCDSDSIDPSMLEGMDMSWLAMNQGGAIFDPNWSWFQPGMDASSLALRTGQVFNAGFDWDLAGASHPASAQGSGSGTISWDALFASTH
ncbi:hypothetical protein C8T65DRAFT_570009 [Cerioporus squamosus]|nr:hypothetical protein C8T65DRAFT_570009 [Cerioporus squamosus]